MLAQTKLIVLVLVSWLRCFVRNGMRAKQQGIQSNGSLELKRMLLMRHFFETRLFEIKECIWVATPMAYRKSYSGDDILYTGSIV